MSIQTLAATGADQAGAGAITDGFCNVTGADGAKGVRLPDSAVETAIYVYNNSASALLLYPDSGADMNGGAANAAITVAANAVVTCVAVTTTRWACGAATAIGNLATSGGGVSTVAKAASTARGNTTAALDPELLLTLAVGSYSFLSCLQVTTGGAAEGIKATVDGTAVASAVVADIEVKSHAATPILVDGRVTSMGGTPIGQTIAGAGGGTVWVEGTITVSTAGTFGISWAQNATVATSTSVLIGSWLMVWVATASGASGAGIVLQGVALYQEQQTSGTAGGTFTSGAWRTRVLTTEVVDTQGIGTLASNQVTLAAGTYLVVGYGTAHRTGVYQHRIQDLTNTVTLALGIICSVPTAGGGIVPGLTIGKFTLAGTVAIELQGRCETTRASDGFGFPLSVGTEVYSTILIIKLSA